MTLSALKLYTTIIFAGFALIGCGSPHPKPTPPPKPKMKHAPPTPINQKKAELGGTTWNPAWDRIVEQALPAALLSSQVPHDVRRFCPRFYGMSEVNKRAFWAYFFQALAGAEAGLNPRASVRHANVVPARNEDYPVVGRTQGLLQLTYKDAKRYGCDFDRQADSGLKVKDPTRTILQPDNNLTCGIKILENQIIEQRKPLLSRTSYWSTLRPGTKSYRVFAKQMTNPPPACGLHASRKHRRAPVKVAE